MIKVLGLNSIFFIGKVSEIKLQLAAIDNKNITLADYIKLQNKIYKNSLN